MRFEVFFEELREVKDILERSIIVNARDMYESIANNYMKDDLRLVEQLLLIEYYDEDDIFEEVFNLSHEVYSSLLADVIDRFLEGED